MTRVSRKLYPECLALGDINMDHLFAQRSNLFLIFLITIASLSSAAVQAAPADEITVGRYSTLQALPSEAQADLLAAMITVSMPKSVSRVGEAIRHVLQTSGYRLASAAAAHPARAHLFRLSLPGVHRDLGPLSLRVMLETLAGPAFRLVVDPVHRLVSFELCDPTDWKAQAARVRSTTD